MSAARRFAVDLACLLPAFVPIALFVDLTLWQAIAVGLGVGITASLARTVEGRRSQPPYREVVRCDLCESRFTVAGSLPAAVLVIADEWRTLHAATHEVAP